MDAAELAGKYDAHYYAHNCGSPYARDAAWLGLFAGIADRLVSDVLGGGPDGGAVLDAGCAWGLLVEALRERGVEAYGLEVSDYALANVAEEVRPYCAKGSIADPLPRRYRLVVCIEVLEHMTSQDAERALANICAHTDDVLFSSTPFDYKEATHVNVQPPERWGELFARHGFFRDVEHDASYITPWAVRFRRRNEPLPRLVRDYERKYFLLWKENVDLRRLALESHDQLSSLEARLAREAATPELRQAGEQLRQILDSRTWRLLQRLRSLLIPRGSARERLYDRLSRRG